MKKKIALKKAFVSYSHTDFTEAEAIVTALRRSGVLKSVWFDEKGRAIEGGSDWERFINRKIKAADIVFVCLNTDALVREQLRREVVLAKKEGKKIIPILLDQTSLGPLKKQKGRYCQECYRIFSKTQGLSIDNYGGFTSEFYSALIGCLKKPAKFDPHVFANEQIDQAIYVVSNRDPVKTAYSEGQKGYFYRLSVGDIVPTSVTPVALDEEWLPREDYERIRNHEVSDLSKILDHKNALVRRGFVQALLNSRQLIINRSSFQNDSYLIGLYSPEDSDKPYFAPTEKQAFQQLLGNGSLVVALYGEDEPTNDPRKNYEVDDRVLTSWQSFCHDHPLYALSQDWQNPDNRAYLCYQRLGERMSRYFLTFSEQKGRMVYLKKLLGIPAEDESFESLCRSSETSARALLDKKGTYSKFATISRSFLYKNFVYDLTGYSELIASQRALSFREQFENRPNPYVYEFKQLVDLVYTRNFLEAYHIVPLVSEGGINPLDIEVVGQEDKGRELKLGELKYAIAQLDGSSWHGTTFFVPLSALSLSEVLSIRQRYVFQDYLLNLEMLSRRIGHWQFDFSEISKIGEKYTQLISLIAKEGSAESAFARVSHSLTLTYVIEAKKIVTVYRFPRRKGGAITKLFFASDVPVSNSKCRVRISYRFADYFSPTYAENISMDYLFFNGVCEGSGYNFSQDLIRFLTENEHFLRKEPQR